MPELPNRKPPEVRRRVTYWQALLRFGFPVILLYRAGHYLFFLLRARGAEHYPWPFYLSVDTAVVLTISTMWWTFWRNASAPK